MLKQAVFTRETFAQLRNRIETYVIEPMSYPRTVQYFDALFIHSLPYACLSRSKRHRYMNLL